MYPPIERTSVRFDGLSRATPGFLVDPYEPPVVPIKGRYSVFLFDAGGHPVRNIEGVPARPRRPAMAAQRGERRPQF